MNLIVFLAFIVFQEKTCRKQLFLFLCCVDVFVSIQLWQMIHLDLNDCIQTMILWSTSDVKGRDVIVYIYERVQCQINSGSDFTISF